MQGFFYGRLYEGDNEYAHPLDLCPIVDLNEGRVVHIDMEEGKVPKVCCSADCFNVILSLVTAI